MKYANTAVSILLPIYNEESLLPSCLKSLLKQTFKDLEIIAIDDASRDKSYAILRQFARKDKRLKVYRNKKRYGPAICLNRAIKRAKKRFIAFMNPHDIVSLHRIKRQVNFLLTQPKIVAVGTQCTFIDNKGNRREKTAFPTNHEKIYPMLLHNSTMRYETAVIDRFMLPKDILSFATNTYPFIYSEVFMKLLQYGQVANLNQHLYFVRETLGKTFKALTKSDKVLSFSKLFFNAFAEYDYRPSMRQFLKPLFRPIKTIFE